MTIDLTAARARLDALTSHTPGPWIGEDGYVTTADAAHEIAGVFSRKLADEEEANTRLLAAAPDLVADLRAALDEIERLRAERAQLDKGLDRLNAHPDIKRGLEVFCDHWGMDSYTSPANIESIVRNLVAWFLSKADARAALEASHDRA